MIDIKNLPDAWDMIERIGGEEAKEKEELYDIYYKISTALFDYRLKYELSQKKLAEKLGVTQPMVAKLESGDYNYTIEQLWKIATKLGFKFSIDFQEIESEISVISCSENWDNVVDYDVEYMAVGA
jgi:ribosome-binding protein aMBF1 (putative translation factor)